MPTKKHREPVTKQQFDAGLKKQDKKFEKQFQQQEQRLTKIIDEKIDQQEQRLTNVIDGKIDQLEQRLDQKIDNAIEKITHHMSIIQETVYHDLIEGTKDKISLQDDKLANHDERLIALERTRV